MYFGDEVLAVRRDLRQNVGLKLNTTMTGSTVDDAPSRFNQLEEVVVRLSSRYFVEIRFSAITKKHRFRDRQVTGSVCLLLDVRAAGMNFFISSPIFVKFNVLLLTFTKKIAHAHLYTGFDRNVELVRIVYSIRVASQACRVCAKCKRGSEVWFGSTA